MKAIDKIAIKIEQIKVLLVEIEKEYSVLKYPKETKVIKMKNKPSDVFLQTVTSICNRKKIKTF